MRGTRRSPPAGCPIVRFAHRAVKRGFSEHDGHQWFDVDDARHVDSQQGSAERRGDGFGCRAPAVLVPSMKAERQRVAACRLFDDCAELRQRGRIQSGRVERRRRHEQLTNRARRASSPPSPRTHRTICGSARKVDPSSDGSGR